MSKEQARKIEEEKKETIAQTRRDIVQDVADEMGVISENTRVTGDIYTGGHLGIAGHVEGNVEAKGSVIIKGVIKGDIICQNLIVESGKVYSNITCSDRVQVKNSAMITGHIDCKDIVSAGTITGEINCQDQTSFACGAIINADVVTKKLSVELGAKFNGNLRMK